MTTSEPAGGGTGGVGAGEAHYVPGLIQGKDGNYYVTGAYSPLPSLSSSGLSEMDPRLYEIWREYNAAQFASINKRSESVFRTYLDAYKTVVWMYRITFGVGISSFAMAIISTFYFQQAMFPILFGSMTVASFATIFFFRPPEALEEGLEFPTWLDIVQKFSVVRTMYFSNPETINSDLKAVTDETINQIVQIIEKRQEIHTKKKRSRD